MRVVAAVLATALLVGGTTATAASLVTSANIKDNTVRGKDVRNRSITLRDLSRATIRALRGQRGPAGPAGPQGAAGAPGQRGANGVTDITYVDSPLVPVAPGAAGSAIAVCPPGTVATGGSEGPASDVEFSGASRV